jgi:hypothetical protein
MTHRQAWKIVKNRIDNHSKYFRCPFIVPFNDWYAFYLIFRVDHLRNYGADGVIVVNNGSNILGIVNRIEIHIPTNLQHRFNTKAFDNSDSFDPFRLVEYNPLLGCDGNPHNDDFLIYRWKLAVEREDYEEAAIFRDEAKRRGIEDKFYQPTKYDK